MIHMHHNNLLLYSLIQFYSLFVFQVYSKRGIYSENVTSKSVHMHISVLQVSFHENFFIKYTFHICIVSCLYLHVAL